MVDEVHYRVISLASRLHPNRMTSESADNCDAILDAIQFEVNRLRRIVCEYRVQRADDGRPPDISA